MVVDALVAEGEENLHATYLAGVNVADALVELTASKNPSAVLKDKGKPAAMESVGSQSKNVKWGSKSESKTVDPKKIQ